MHIHPSPFLHFDTPKASIDFITIQLPNTIKEPHQARRLQDRISGHISCPNRWRDNRDDWITIHDPTQSDLQWLLDHYPETRIRCLEVSVDFHLADKSNDPELLHLAHTWLTMRLFPERHPSMERVAKRRYYDLRKNQIIHSGMRPKNDIGSVYWTNPRCQEQVRLYVKKQDKFRQVSQHSVRLEVTLFEGGCQNIDLHRLAELPQFADVLRKYLSRFLFVASGIKPKLKRMDRATTNSKREQLQRLNDREQARVARNWERYGAIWCSKHDYSPIPDTESNRKIGIALKRLRKRLQSLKLTQKVANTPSYEPLHRTVRIEHSEV
jgi:hypothetical protein